MARGDIVCDKEKLGVDALGQRKSSTEEVMMLSRRSRSPGRGPGELRVWDARILHTFALAIGLALVVVGYTSSSASAAGSAPVNDSFAAATVIGLADLPYTTTQDSL